MWNHFIVTALHLAVLVAQGAAPPERTSDDPMQVESFFAMLDHTEILSKTFEFSFDKQGKAVDLTVRQRVSSAKKTTDGAVEAQASLRLGRGLDEDRCLISVAPSSMVRQTNERGAIMAAVTRWLLQSSRDRCLAEVTITKLTEALWKVHMDYLPRTPDHYLVLRISRKHAVYYVTLDDSAHANTWKRQH